MAKYIVNANKRKSQISKHIYGHFSEHLGRCIYEGIWVGENSPIPNTEGIRNDVLEALRKIKVPVLRWPGGCFADEYHWKDGIGKLEDRKKMINTHWGGVVEDNSFGTHEFLRLCEMLECEPYISGNLGSGTVQEMSEWVEYMTFDGISPMAKLRGENGKETPWSLKFFGVGNENWGCGGNMSPEYYADLYKQYQTYVRNYNGNNIYKIACGPNGDDYNWTEVVMAKAKNHMNGFSLHYYTVPNDWSDKGSATVFSEEDYYKTLSKTFYMEELITKHSAIMDKYDPEKSIGLMVDEWGTWYNVEPGTNPGFLYQQNTMRDAVLAAINLNIFNKHADRVKMANIAQVVNVLQSVILTEGEKMLLTPTYHVFDLFSVHQENTLLESAIETTTIGSESWQVVDLHESTSMDESGNIYITLCNLSVTEEKTVDGELLNFVPGEAEGMILTGAMTSHNTFEHQDAVTLQELAVSLKASGFEVVLPPCSVARIKITQKMA